LAVLAYRRLRATPAELRDALGASIELNPVYRWPVRLALDDLQLIEQQVGQLEQEIASLLREHQGAVQRLAEVPGLRVDSALQIIAEVGAKVATFAFCQESSLAGRSMPGRRRERRCEPQQTLVPRAIVKCAAILNQAANAAVKQKGSIFEMVYRRFVPRLGRNKTIGTLRIASVT
jgi:transposase